MLMLETLARALVEKLEARHDVDLSDYAQLKSWLDETAQERLDFPNIVEWASEIWCFGNDGEIEIDDDPFLSVGCDGVWVSAWVWVPNSKMEDDDEQG